MKHQLVFENMMSAKCSCGEWAYIGLSPEAKTSIQKVYKYHLTVPPKKTKKRK
jgi:hypothetical protein